MLRLSLIFVLLRMNGELDPFYRDLNVHIIVVSSIAACALVVALVSTRAVGSMKRR